MTPRGFSLVELLIAVLLAAIVAAGLLILASTTSQAWHAQRNLSQMNENARYAIETLGRHIESAGFHPQPWLASSREALLPESRDDDTASSDVLALTRHSSINCLGNENPATDLSGAPRDDLMQVAFWLNNSGSLVMRCRYGPDPSSLVTQLNQFSLVDHVDAFQALYAEDADGDGSADRWSKPDNWVEESRVRGVRIALLLGTPDPVRGEHPASFQLLDKRIAVSDPDHAHRVFESTFAIRGRM